MARYATGAPRSNPTATDERMGSRSLAGLTGASGKRFGGGELGPAVAAAIAKGELCPKEKQVIYAVQMWR